MSDFKRGAFNYIAYYLRSGQYLPGSCRTETILTYHRAEKSRKLRRVELSSSLYSSMPDRRLESQPQLFSSPNSSVIYFCPTRRWGKTNGRLFPIIAFCQKPSVRSCQKPSVRKPFSVREFLTEGCSYTF
jgi:hypothetical protein